MMNFKLTPSQRKLALALHVTTSVGLLGAIAAFLVLAIAGFSSQDEPLVRAAYLAMDLITRWVIVPLALASILSGVFQALGTPWGLFQHYWVLAKLVITAFATVILLIKLPLIGHAARLAAEAILPHADLRAAGMELLVHSAAGLMVLLVPVILSVFKPKGLTPFGRRNQEENLTPEAHAGISTRRPYPGSNGGPAARPARAPIGITIRPANALGFLTLVIFVHIVIFHLAGAGLGGH